MVVDLRHSITWDVSYNTSTHDLINDFYTPVLSNCIRYDRASGYFSSGVLAAASLGYEAFCKNPGSKMRLIVGLQISPQDYNRLLFNLDPDLTDSIIREKIELELNNEEMPDFERSRLSGLTWMLVNGKLEVKFGVMLNQITKEPMAWDLAKFHGKMAIFSDSSDPKSEEANTAVITGSINETLAGWTLNGEDFVPQVSWEPGRSRDSTFDRMKLFEQYWSSDGINKNLNVGIFTLSDIDKTMLKFVEPIHPSKTTPWENQGKNTVTNVDADTSDEDPRWVHQATAVELFLKEKDPSLSTAPMPAGKQGILCMATGTGKTRTALKIVKEMYESSLIENIIITTHKTDVLEQWSKEIFDPKRGLEPHIMVTYRSNDWSKFLFMATKNKCLIVGRQGFEKLLQTGTENDFSKTLLIVDECHNFRGEGGRDKLLGMYQKIPYRLGLSATPESEYNDEATQFLFDEIGPLYYNFGLADAIAKGILCPFEYTPISYSPLAKEIAEVGAIRKKFEGAKKKNPAAATSIIKRMQMEMAKVWKKSEGKHPGLEEILSKPKNLVKCIIFGPEKKYNSKILELLQKANSNHGLTYTEYYGETDKKYLDFYRNGRVQVLLTCKAISEGVDLDVNTIVLVASDGPKLETIQRIGRALRTHGDATKVAKVIDFIRDNSDDSADTRRREWLKELSESGLKSWSAMQEEEE